MSCFAAIGLNDRERGSLSLALTQIDGLLELGEFGVGALLNRGKSVLLRRVVGCEAPQRIEAMPNLLNCRVIWAEVTFIVGEQIAPLAGFGVFHSGKDILQCGERFPAVNNESAVLFQSLEIEIGDRA